MKSLWVGIKDVLLWSYARGTWQYDLLCLLIVCAVFLIPSHYFGDRDRTTAAEANRGQTIASNAAFDTLEFEDADLQRFLQGQNRMELIQSPEVAISFYLRDKLKREVTITGYRAFKNTQGKPGYIVWYQNRSRP